jgi:hypothetical protein
MSKPLVFTTKGNMPIDLLDYSQEWEDNIGCDISLAMENGHLVPKVQKTGHIVFKEFYRLKETGEIVRQDAHVCAMQAPEFAELTQGSVT